MEVKNYLGRDVDIVSRTGAIVTIPSSGKAKIIFSRENAGTAFYGVSEIDFKNTNILSYSGLPDENQNTILIVSSFVYSCLSQIRRDLVVIDEPFSDKNIKYARCVSMNNHNIVLSTEKSKVISDMALMVDKYDFTDEEIESFLKIKMLLK